MLSIKSEQNVIVQNDAGIRGKKFHEIASLSRSNNKN